MKTGWNRRQWHSPEDYKPPEVEPSIEADTQRIDRFHVFLNQEWHGCKTNTGRTLLLSMRDDPERWI